MDLAEKCSRAERILNSGIPWLILDTAFDHKAALDEVTQVKHHFVSHRSDGRGWKSLCLHGLSSTLTEHPEKYGFYEGKAPYSWTEIADACPVTTSFVKRLPFAQFYRVRFMLLEPLGYIRPHMDNQAKGLYTINVALSNPVGSYFKMQGFGNLPFRPGLALFIDTSNTHCLINLSEEPRFHMIVDGVKDNDNPEFADLVCRSYDLTWGQQDTHPAR